MVITNSRSREGLGLIEEISEQQISIWKELLVQYVKLRNLPSLVVLDRDKKLSNLNKELGEHQLLRSTLILKMNTAINIDMNEDPSHINNQEKIV